MAVCLTICNRSEVELVTQLVKSNIISTDNAHLCNNSNESFIQIANERISAKDEGSDIEIAKVETPTVIAPPSLVDAEIIQTDSRHSYNFI